MSTWQHSELRAVYIRSQWHLTKHIIKKVPFRQLSIILLDIFLLNQCHLHAVEELWLLNIFKSEASKIGSFLGHQDILFFWTE